MSEMKDIRQEYLTGERPLFKGENLKYMIPYLQKENLR